tara:strand:- start:444 stop:3200 length:2757 start_codon:yes stop_codon:yes gene_type:complete
MKKTFFFITLFIVTHITNAQIDLTGIVKDSIGNPLEMANIIGIHKETKKIASYGFTDSKGRYKLSLAKNSTFTLKISYVGMKSSDLEITTKDVDLVKNATLYNDNVLDEINIISRMPVTIKGDTIIYNADSFKNGSERKLEDVIKKIPGMEINDDGEIEVEGKVVSKVMVEGKDFFDGDSKLAIKNIPANAVDKVQVLKNFAEVNQLKGVQNNQDNIAINIKLKEGKKSFWFGDVTFGGNSLKNNSLYIAQSKLFYYSPKYSINFIGDLNNIGEVAFTRRDYFNFTGGFRNPSRQSGTNIDLGGNNLGFLTLQNNRAKDINTKFGAFNFSYAPKPTLDVSGFAIFSSSRIQLQENRSVQYNEVQDNPSTSQTEITPQDEKTKSNTHQKSDLGMIKFSTNYKPNGNNQLDYDIQGRISKESQDQHFSSNINGAIDQKESSSPYSVNQNINYYFTLNERNIFAFEAQSLLQDEDPFYNAILENNSTNIDDSYDPTASFLGLNSFQQNYNVAQKKRVKSNQIDAKLDYWNVLNKKSNINLTLGTIFSKQDFNSSIFQNLDNNITYSPTPNTGYNSNDIGYTFTDVYLGLHYQYKTGIFTFTPGISAHTYSTKNTQFSKNYKDDFFRFLPDFNVNIQLKKSETLRLNYRMQTQFTDVNKFASGLVLNNYNAIYIGNPTLENALSHNINLSYFNFNMFNYTNIFANIDYIKSINNIRTSFKSPDPTNQTIQVNTPFNSGLADENLTANGRFQKTFTKYRASLNANFSYNKFNQILNNNQSTNKNYSQTYRARFGTNFRKAPNIDLSYRYSIQDNDQGATRTKFFTNAPSIEFDAYFWQAVTFKTSYTYNRFSNETTKLNDYQFLDASLAYRKNKDAKWEYQLKATNLLDTKSQNNSSAGNIFVSATEYFIQPRFVTFRLIYQL